MQECVNIRYGPQKFEKFEKLFCFGKKSLNIKFYFSIKGIHILLTIPNKENYFFIICFKKMFFKNVHFFQNFYEKMYFFMETQISFKCQRRT